MPRALSSILRGALLLLIVAPNATAQIHHIETIRETDGLPSPDIKSIAQDHWGVVWISTRGGIAFNDGISWIKAPLDSLTSFASDGLLETDKQGNLWALLSGKRPMLLRNDFCKWESFPLPPDIAAKYTDFTHFALVPHGDQTVAAITLLPNLMYVSTEESWVQVPLTELGIINIHDLKAVDDHFVLATPQGAFTVSASSPIRLQPLLDIKPITPPICFSPNRLDNSLWIAGKNWIGRLDKGIFEYLLPPQDEEFLCFSEPFTKICQTDGFGGIYLSGIFSTQYFHPQTGLEHRGPNNGFSEFGTADFFLDRELVLWQGTSLGVNKLLGRHTAGYNKSQGLLTNEVTALLRRSDGTIIVGHNNGLTLWDDQMIPQAFTGHDFRNRVLDLAEDSMGNIWIACRQRGLGCLASDGTLKWWNMGKDLSKYIVSVIVDDQGLIWIAASSRIMVWDRGVFTEIPLSPEAENGLYFRRLIKGRDGTIFVATGNGGLMVIKDNEIQRLTTRQGGHSDSIFDVLETDDGITWVGTHGGLFQLVEDQLVRPLAEHLNITRPVYFIKLDARNRMWLGTDNGILRIDGDQVTPITVESGLLGRETNRCAGLVGPDGTFMVGTEQGLTIIDDRFENTAPLAPQIYLVSLDAAGDAYPLHSRVGEISLPTDASNLIFNYRVFTTTEADRLKIMYRLDGIDTDWEEMTSGGEQIIRYNNLPAGTFRFHVKAAGFGQPWSETISSPSIIIPAPIWHRIWFRILMALAIATMLTLPMVFIMQRRYTIRLQNEVKEQVAANLRIETELEQARNLRSLGLLAGGIAHDFNNLLTIIFGNLSLLQGDQNLKPEQQKRINTATGAIERARGLTNQLLTFSRGGAPILKEGSLSYLVRESTDFIFRGSSAKCQFNLPDNLWPVVMDSGQMSQVVNNLLVNALEAMPASGRVVLNGRNLDEAPAGLAPGQYVEITVNDNGTGISQENLSKIFDPYFSTKEKGSGLGLATAFSILGRHKGRLSVESSLGQGATFKLLVPACVSSLKKDDTVQQVSVQLLEGTVLLLDDDPEVRQSLGHMLERLGLKVESTAEGRETLQRYKDLLGQGYPPEIVLMDLTIPGGQGGHEIIGTLLEMDPHAKAIVISGYSHSPVMSQYQQHGFKAAIAKPITVNELGLVLRSVLAM